MKEVDASCVCQMLRAWPDQTISAQRDAGLWLFILRQPPSDPIVATHIFVHVQNLVDSLGQRFRAPVPQERHGELNTFVVFNRRQRVTSSAKRRRVPGSLHLAQTPDGSFLDLQRNAAELLQRCGFLRIPEVCNGGCDVWCACVRATCYLLRRCREEEHF